MGPISGDTEPTPVEAVKYRIRWGNAALALAGLAALVVALAMPLGGDNNASSRAEDAFWTGPGVRPASPQAPTGPTAGAPKARERPAPRSRERKPRRSKKRSHATRARRPERLPAAPSPSSPPSSPQQITPVPTPDSVDREFGL